MDQLTVHSAEVPIESLQVDGSHIMALRSMKQLALVLVVEARPAVVPLHFLSVCCVLLVKAQVLYSFDTCNIASTSRAVKHAGYTLVLRFRGQ